MKTSLIGLGYERNDQWSHNQASASFPMLKNSISRIADPSPTNDGRCSL